jgi:hypothetical protein
MSNVVNLNQARKRRARAAAEEQAAANRLKFGRTKAQKQRDAAEADEARRKLDRLRLEPPADD